MELERNQPNQNAQDELNRILEEHEAQQQSQSEEPQRYNDNANFESEEEETFDKAERVVTKYEGEDPKTFK